MNTFHKLALQFGCVLLAVFACAALLGGSVLTFSAFLFEHGFRDWHWNLVRLAAGATLIVVGLNLGSWLARILRAIAA